jgi:hypothetical protein
MATKRPKRLQLSQVLLEILETHPGRAFTAQELYERVPRCGRLFPAHVQQALERRLFIEGRAAASPGDVWLMGGFIRAVPSTRWCARRSAPPGFLVYDPDEGVHVEECGERVCVV